jgi:hypothetical protein
MSIEVTKSELRTEQLADAYKTDYIAALIKEVFFRVGFAF